jgi:transforming growth factor-beta-induced protein
MEGGQSIVDIAIANEDFTTLVAAVTAAGLVDTLAGDGPFTVFAPTNDAFGSLPEGTVDTLLLPENIDQLTDILKYHVVSGSVPSSSLESGDVETLNGELIAVDVSDTMGIMLNDNAHVITADIIASNGIIHVIDKVLLPPDDEVSTTMTDDAVHVADDGFLSSGLFGLLGGLFGGEISGEGNDTAGDMEGLDDLLGGLLGGGDISGDNITAGDMEGLDDLFGGLLGGGDISGDNITAGDMEGMDDFLGGLFGGDMSGDNITAGDMEGLDDLLGGLFGGDMSGDNITAGDMEGLDDLLGGLLGGDSHGNVTASDLEDLIGGLLGETMMEGQTIVDIAVANEDFSIVVAAVTAAGLVDTLSGEGPFTVFAPTNDVFGLLPEGTVDTLLLPENIDQLIDILKYHVVSGSVPSSSLESGDVEALNGDSIAVDVSDDMGIILNDDAHVIMADIMASNGIIHVIDKVLLPPEDDDMTSDEPAESSASPVATPATTDEGPGTIVDIAVANEDFTTLVAAVTAAGLVETLARDGPFTVFAPTNEAFDSLPEGTVDTLLLPENIDQLTDILKYHVVAGSVPSSSLKGDVETLNGDSITVTVDVGLMLNDDANVITADIMASNGIIHVIDKVLLPPEDDALTGSAAEESVIVAPGISSATSTWLVSGYVIMFISALFYIVPL